MSDSWFDPHDLPHLQILKAASFALSNPGGARLRTPEAARRWLADRLGIGVERVAFSLRTRETVVEEGTSFQLGSSELGTQMLTEDGIVDARFRWFFSAEISQEHACVREIEPEKIAAALSALLPFWIASELSITKPDNHVSFFLGTSRLGAKLTNARPLP